MLPLLDLARLIFETLFYGLFGWLVNPGLFFFPIMIAVVISMVLRQYVRQAKLEEHLFGATFSQPLRQVLISLGFGILGGLIASFIMTSLGIALSEEMGIIYVWPVVLVLMAINPRFMCFAYGGGVVGLVALLLRGLASYYPGLSNIGLFAGLMAVDLPSLMGLVGLLHLTESFLIFVSGHLNASPIVIESPRGEVVGGFMLQRFWPMPMAALMAKVISETDLIGESIGMPAWWPLLKPLLEPGPGMILMLYTFPIVAALGYSDIAVSTTPREKSRWSARNLLVYSLLLISLAIAAGYKGELQILPVLFAPLAHEYLIQTGNRREWRGQPLLGPATRGVRLLTVLPNSPAQEQGLDSGWIILTVNGIEVNTRQQLTHALNLLPGLAELDVISPQGQTRSIRLHQRQGKIGLVPVPDGTAQSPYLKLGGKGFLLRLWEKIKTRKSGV